MATMKNDPQQDPAEGSRSAIESDLGETSGSMSSGTSTGSMSMNAASDQLMSVASDLARDLPSKLGDAMDSLGTTATRLRGEDEETLTAAYAAGLGLTLGLLFAGANRLFILFALGPTAFLGAALFGRLRGTTATTTSRR